MVFLTICLTFYIYSTINQLIENLIGRLIISEHNKSQCRPNLQFLMTCHSSDILKKKLINVKINSSFNSVVLILHVNACRAETNS